MNVPPVTPQLNALRWQLLLSSLAVLGLTLGSFVVIVYQVVAYNLSQKLNQELATLADAAAHSLPEILQQHSVSQTSTPRSLDNDGDLDIPWQDLRQNQQSIEWFDASGQRLGTAGKAELEIASLPHPQTLEQSDKRLLTIPVYAPSTSSKQLQGYVRVSSSTAAVHEELERLRTGLGLGSLGVLTFCGLGSWWLMRQSIRPIERSFQQLQQFTADASHELRNPLTGIKTSIAVLQSHPERIHPADVGKIAAIASAADQMTQLVEDLLLLARTDRQAAVRIVFPLDELLEELVEDWSMQAEIRQISLKADLSSQAMVRGDSAQLKRLFANLLENALKYTLNQGTVTVESLTEDDWVIVRVKDSGIGIAPDQLPHVFDRFWRADESRTQPGGTGLGLAIAQNIVQAHHGTITVTSQLNAGSCFQVRLPRMR